MKIKKIEAKPILDSRKEKTISVTLYTNVGKFSSSAPNGKSRGRNEVKPYKKSLEEDIKILSKLSEYFENEILESFKDLHRVEDILDGHVGGNSFVAFEYAVLKAIAKEQKKQVWQLINPNAKRFPRLVGNCVGGGKHSKTDKKPDFQEFLLIPKSESPRKNFETNKELKEETEFLLKEKDKKFNSNKNDENAWITSLNEKDVLDVLKKLKIPLGLDVAASSFYKRKNYLYKNPRLRRDPEEQFNYISNLIKNYNLFYVEDPFYEEDFESFAMLKEKFPNSLIVGDDLTVTNSNRLKKAIKNGSINAIIVKPNQCGSLIEVQRVCEIAKKNKIKLVFSHRSAETDESILADLAFGFQADFLKCGIDGKVREAKLKRLIEIEKNLKK